MKFAALILVVFLSQQARPGATSTIRGVVLRSGTSTPVDRAVVGLSTGKNLEPRAVTTTSNGRFEFLNVPPGSYELTATRSGFLDTSFGQRGPSGSGTTLKVEAGTTLDNIELLMTATGAIAGRVFDETGEPLAKVTIQALKYSYVEGERSLAEIGSDTTNDLGEFRLFWLPPGRYFLSALPEGGGIGDMFFFKGGKVMLDTAEGRVKSEAILIEKSRFVSKPSTDRALVPAYYPGTADPQLATVVDVRSGADVRGIDFRLSNVTTRKVRGTLIDSTTGQPTSMGNVTLLPRIPFDARFDDHISPSENGTFEFTGIRPGSYLVVANAMIGAEGGEGRAMGGSTPVEVADSDVSHIVVNLQPAITIEGAISIEGQATLPPDIFPGVSLPSPQRGRTSEVFTAEYQDNINSRFRIPNVMEGDYRLSWESSDNLPPGLYLKSASFGPVDALNESIRVDQRTRERLEIVLGANAGTATGTVFTRDRKPAPGMKVVLIPDAAHRQRNDLYRTTVSDQSGQFRIERIPPGDYSLLAWEDIEDGLWRDPEVLRQHAASGSPLHIVENGRERIEIIAIPLSQ